MKTKTAPTSPKYAVENGETLKSLWREQDIQPPARIPLVVVATWTFIFTVVAVVLIIGGLAWYLQRVPNSRLKNYLPASVTTVIASVPSTISADAPNAVRQVADSAIPLVVAPGDNGVSTDAQVTGTATVLSSSGWLVTLRDALPAGVTVAGVTSQGQTLAPDPIIRDPASDLVFLKTSGARLTPTDFAPADKVKAGQSVWVIVRRLSAAVAIRRQLLPAAKSWQSCDHFSPTWVLDEPVTAPLGAPILNDNGQLVGLLGASQAVWTSDMIDPVLKTLFDRQTVERPTCGFHYLPTTSAAAKSTSPTGIMIGAAAGGVAIDSKSPAEKAGLQTGDIIVGVANRAVTSWLSTMLTAQPGQTVELTISRNQGEKKVTLTFGLLRP